MGKEVSLVSGTGFGAITRHIRKQDLMLRQRPPSELMSLHCAEPVLAPLQVVAP